jgi:hypothetical protein
MLFTLLYWGSDPSATGIRKALHGGALIDQLNLYNFASRAIVFFSSVYSADVASVAGPLI